MNTLVVYDSQFGNTEMIARTIADTLAEFGTARAVRVTEYTPGDLQGVGLLVIGCPTQAWHSTKEVQSFIKRLEDQPPTDLCVAEFDTRLDKPRWLTGSAASGMAKKLKEVGVNLLPPESFLVMGTEGPLVEGELERAARWARSLHDEFQVQMGPVPLPM
jgi:flavodoxin